MWNVLRGRSFFSLFAVLLLLDPAAWAAAKKKTPQKAECIVALRADSSVPQGVLKHGEHWVDLILAQAGQESPRAGRAFEELARELLAQAEHGTVPLVNEKIDGSPSVVIGFTAQGLPFVTYKGDLTAKKQRLVTSAADAEKMFRGALQPVYAQAIAELAPGFVRWAQAAQLQGIDPRELVFQGDLLFAESGSAQEGADKARVLKSADAVRIQANSLAYVVRAGHPYFEKLQSARVGLALHSVGRRVVGADGRVDVVAWNVDTATQRAAVEGVVAQLAAPTLFAVDPWRNDVRLARRLSAAELAEAERLIGEIRARLAALTPDFKRAWSATHEARFRIFFNSFLKPPSAGGFFRDARDGRELDYPKLMRRMNGWLAERIKRETEPETYEAALGELRDDAMGAQLRGVIEAYYAASRLQYLLMPALTEAFASKLGCGEVEGLMLQTSDTVVKFVDRLGFTLRNNAHWNRGETAQEVTGATGPTAHVLPAPLDAIHGGEAFVLMKGQPVHSGHIAMIREAVQRSGGGTVHVILSSKEPNLAATHWRELGVADTRKTLERGNYTYVFDVALKREILEAGLKREITRGTVQIHALNPGLLWVASARLLRERETAVALKRPILLVLGEKEMDQARYDDQLEQYAGVLEPLVVPMQSGGVSGTQVRRALRDVVSEDAQARAAGLAVLEASLQAVPNARTRARLVKRIVERYSEVHERVGKLLKM